MTQVSAAVTAARADRTDTSQSRFVVGYATARREASALISAPTDSSVAPGAIVPITVSVRTSRGRLSSSGSGTQMSIRAKLPNSTVGDITPMIVSVWPSSENVRPRTVGSLLKNSCQNRWLITPAGARPGVSSPSWKSRPRTAESPQTLWTFVVTRARATRRASPAPINVPSPISRAARSENDAAVSRQSR